MENAELVLVANISVQSTMFVCLCVYLMYKHRVRINILTASDVLRGGGALIALQPNKTLVNHIRMHILYHIPDIRSLKWVFRERFVFRTQRNPATSTTTDTIAAVPLTG